MKTVVTGGAGFIGSHLVDLLLANGHEVIILDNFSSGRLTNLGHVEGAVKIVECDLASEGEWQDNLKEVNWVFHLAALADIVPSIRHPQDYYRSNVDGTFNILEASRFHGIDRFIYAASSSCYGIPTKSPTPETAKIDLQYPYALTKRVGEELVLHWAKVYHLPVLSLRLFNVYGPRSRTSGTYGAVFGVFLAQKNAGKPFTIVGDGEQTRDFTYVSDVAEAFYLAAKSTKSGKVYNVGSGETVSINRLVDLLQGKKVFIAKRPGEPDCTFADISMIKAELGWKPAIKIEEGVANMLDVIDYWSEAPVWTPETIAIETKDWFSCLK